MTADLRLFTQGAITVTCVIAALFFFRFWRTSGDRLFAFFSAAFCLLGVNWAEVALVQWDAESRHHAYWARLVAYALILVGIADKNRRARAASGGEPSQR